MKMTPVPDIDALVLAVQIRYREFYAPYGTSGGEKNGTGFRIAGIAATFSAICSEDTPNAKYDIQVESYPPGDYIYTDIVTLDQLLSLVEEFKKPIECWPKIGDRDTKKRG